MGNGKEVNQQSDEKDSTTKCYHCDKPATSKRGEIPLCVDCYYKMAQADFMEQQILHNQLSWNASNLNFLEQELLQII